MSAVQRTAVYRRHAPDVRSDIGTWEPRSNASVIGYIGWLARPRISQEYHSGSFCLNIPIAALDGQQLSIIERDREYLPFDHREISQVPPSEFPERHSCDRRINVMNVVPKTAPNSPECGRAVSRKHASLNRRGCLGLTVSVIINLVSFQHEPLHPFSDRLRHHDRA